MDMKILVWAFVSSLINPTFTVRLLFSSYLDIRMFWTKGNMSNERVLVKSSGLNSIVGIDFHFIDQIVFWTDASEAQISRLSLRDSIKPKVIISQGLVKPEGLAVDWVTRKIYWTDAELKLVEVANFDGEHRKVLVWRNVDTPRAIAVDPSFGYLFWTEWGEKPKISRSGMDGSNKTDLVTTAITWPNGLTLNYNERRLYWVDAEHKFIANTDYYGNGRRITYNGALNHPFALTMLGKELFWTEWDTQSIQSCKLYENKVTNGSRMVQSNIRDLMDIKVFESARQPRASYNACKNKNGDCSHLCLLGPSAGSSCACPTGVRLLPNNKTCENGPQTFLLFTTSIDIRIVSLGTEDYRDLQLPISLHGQVSAVEFDPVEKFVYWADSQFQEIKRAHINGSGEIAIVKNDVHTAEGLALDWINRKLYWTDVGMGLIQVCHVNGSSKIVLISENLGSPRSIVVDPNEGFIYWTDWGVNPKLERARIDGTDRKMLVNSSIVWPNGIVLDHSARKIYWADAKLDKIEVCDLNGDNRSIVTQIGVPHIIGFTMLEDYLYWTDSKRRTIERMHKNNTKDRQIVIKVRTPSFNMALKAVDLQSSSN